MPRKRRPGNRRVFIHAALHKNQPHLCLLSSTGVDRRGGVKSTRPWRLMFADAVTREPLEPRRLTGGRH